MNPNARNKSVTASKWGSVLCWASEGTVAIIAAIIERPATFCKLPKFGNLLCQFENDPRAVCCGGTSGATLVHDPWIRPERYARATAATYIVAHDVAPLGAINVAMPIGKWRVGLIDKAIVPHSKNMSYFVGDRHGDRGARVMHHKEGFVRFRANARRKAATGGIVDDQANDVGALLVAQFLYVLKRTERRQPWRTDG